MLAEAAKAAGVQVQGSAPCLHPATCSAAESAAQRLSRLCCTATLLLQRCQC